MSEEQLFEKWWKKEWSKSLDESEGKRQMKEGWLARADIAAQQLANANDEIRELKSELHQVAGDRARDRDWFNDQAATLAKVTEQRDLALIACGIARQAINPKSLKMLSMHEWKAGLDIAVLALTAAIEGEKT